MSVAKVSTKEERIQAAFDKHLTALRSSSKRAELRATADRLGDAVHQYRHLIDGAEADAFAEVIQILTEIAEGDRG